MGGDLFLSFSFSSRSEFGWHPGLEGKITLMGCRGWVAFTELDGWGSYNLGHGGERAILVYQDLKLVGSIECVQWPCEIPCITNGDHPILLLQIYGYCHVVDNAPA